MTYKEYVQVMLGKFGLSDAEIEFILTESDLNPASVVSSTDDRILIKKAIFKSIPLMIAGLQDVSEGGYSVKWNFAGLKAWYSLLATELGEDDMLIVAPTCRDASNRW